MGEIGGIKTAWRQYVCIEVKCLDRYTGGKNGIFQEMVYTTHSSSENLPVYFCSLAL